MIETKCVLHACYNGTPSRDSQSRRTQQGGTGKEGAQVRELDQFQSNVVRLPCSWLAFVGRNVETIVTIMALGHRSRPDTCVSAESEIDQPSSLHILEGFPQTDDVPVAAVGLASRFEDLE